MLQTQKRKIAEKYARLLEDPALLVILDTETTGLDPNQDMPVSIAMINGTGQELLNTLVKPVRARLTEGAIAVHGITEEMVENAPFFTDLYGRYRELLHGKTVLAYNAPYDAGILSNAKRVFLPGDTPEGVGWICVMRDYAAFNGTPGKYGSPKWWKLVEACQNEGIEAQDAHDALGDVRMTLKLMKAMAASLAPEPLSDRNWHQRLVEIAKAEEDRDHQLPNLQEEYDRLYAEHLASIAELIEQVKTLPDQLRDTLKTDVLDYYRESGDKSPHNLIQVREQTRFEYDKDAVLAWARDNARTCVRVKESLDVKTYEGSIDEWQGAPPYETVIVPVVALSKTDHLISDPE